MVEVNSDKLIRLIDRNATAQKLTGGFQFTEGPLWHPIEQCLLFSDIPGNTIYRWDEAGVSVYRGPSSMSNGLTFDRELNLIACEHAASRVTRTEPNGSVESIEVVADRWNGKELNSPNDVVVKSDGAIYFTDPAYGRGEFVGIKRKQDLPFQGVYRVAANGYLSLLEEHRFAAPNGLCFSPDEKTFYVNDSERRLIIAYNVLADGLLGSGEVFFNRFDENRGAGNPDGMKVDDAGNVYCAGPGGIWIISPQGEHLGTVLLPEVCSNLNWGGTDWNELYITASTSIYRLPMKVCGNRLGYMTRK